MIDLRRARVRAGVVCVVVGSCACASTHPDPFERENRATFAFNELLDRSVARPVARGWDFVTPRAVQTRIENFYANLDMPMVLANDLLALRPRAAAQDLARLVSNTLLGVAGLFDVASQLGIPKNDADFGLTLGRWGVSPGAYLVVPFLGPFSVRDGVGAGADGFAHPHVYFVPVWVSFALYALRVTNARALYDEEIEDARAAAFDYYLFVRDAYLQNRKYRVEGRRTPALPADDLYYADEADPDDER